jgi:hypothetical protein
MRANKFAQGFALYGGIAMLLMGFLALIPALSVVPYEGLPVLRIDYSYGMFLGFFPMNILNKIALMAFGVAGILVSREAARSYESSVLYSRAVFFVMGALAILGMFPLTNTLFGFWPLYGGEIFAHAIFAILGAYFGYHVFKGEYNSPAYPR